MFKFIILGVWVNITVAIAVLFSSGKASSLLGMEETKEGSKKNIETLVLPPISAALIRRNGVIGYFIIEVAFSHVVDKKNAGLPIEPIFRNAVISSLYANPDIDETQLEALNFEDLQQRIKNEVKEKAGDGLLETVLIQSIDYRTIEEIRDNKLRRLTN